VSPASDRLRLSPQSLFDRKIRLSRLISSLSHRREFPVYERVACKEEVAADCLHDVKGLLFFCHLRLTAKKIRQTLTSLGTRYAKMDESSSTGSYLTTHLAMRNVYVYNNKIR
jgi:hypothetical protein